MNYHFLGRRVTGVIVKYNKKNMNGKVAISPDEKYSFHGTSYSSPTSTPPKFGDIVEVVLMENALLEVTAVRVRGGNKTIWDLMK